MNPLPAHADALRLNRAKYGTDECTACGHTYHPVRRNQKVCRPCRLLSDLDYWTEAQVKAQKCSACKEPFLRTSRNDHLCSNCNPGLPNIAKLECLTCGSPDHGLERPYTPICRHCARWPDNGLRALARKKLREWIHPAAPAAEHPLLRATRNAANAAAGRTGLGADECIRSAKIRMGLEPDESTQDLPELIRYLEAL